MARRRTRTTVRSDAQAARSQGRLGNLPTPLRPGAEVAPASGPRRDVTVIGRLLTPTQLSAVRSIMRLFVEDDLANGVSPAEQVRCVACEGWRSAPGFIRYEQLDFCNVCATDFELARLRGLARSAAAYLESQQRPASA